MFGPPAFVTWLTADRWSAWQHMPVMALIRRTLAPVALGLLSAGCYTLFRLGADTPGRATLAVIAFALVALWNRAPWQVVAAAAVVGIAVWR
jgi:chromate transport protein ChrA